MSFNRMPSYKKVNPITGTMTLRSISPASLKESRRSSVASTASTASTASNTPTLSNYSVTGVNNNNRSRRLSGVSVLSSNSIEYGNMSNAASVGSVGSGASSSSFYREQVPRSGSVSSTERALSTRMHASSTGVEHAKHSSALKSTPKQSLRMLTAKNFAGFGQVSPVVQTPSSLASSSSVPSSSSAAAPIIRNKSRNPFTNAPKNKKNNSAFTITNPMKKSVKRKNLKTRKLRRVPS